MGQASSHDRTKASKKLANFYHICNIIPDTPEHHHNIWQVPQENTVIESSRRNTSHSKKKQNKRNARKWQTSKPFCSPTRSYESGTEHTSDTEYTSDDGSDMPSVTTHRNKHRKQHKHKSSSCAHSTQQMRDFTQDDCDNVYSSLPEMLDRRYDLDIAPSMVNMDLRFNGAHMVTNTIYNILVCKFGYHHMLSVQMLFWLAVHKYYQIHCIDTQNNYKLSLCTFLDIVKDMSLCSERDLSIYTNIAEKVRLHKNETSSHNEEQDEHGSTFSITNIANTHTFQKPFYTMDYYYVPKDPNIMQQALLHDHLILANLTLFSNFLSARRGHVPFPNSDDQSAGMIVVTIVGYQENTWIVKFPFGVHWGDHGFGYVSFDYFQRYNRDRWIIDIVECGEPPEYAMQRKQEQLSGHSELIAAHMEPTHTSLYEQNHEQHVTKPKQKPITNQIRRRMI